MSVICRCVFSKVHVFNSTFLPIVAWPLFMTGVACISGVNRPWTWIAFSFSTSHQMEIKGINIKGPLWKHLFLMSQEKRSSRKCTNCNENFLWFILLLLYKWNQFMVKVILLTRECQWPTHWICVFYVRFLNCSPYFFKSENRK